MRTPFETASTVPMAFDYFNDKFNDKKPESALKTSVLPESALPNSAS